MRLARPSIPAQHPEPAPAHHARIEFNALRAHRRRVALQPLLVDAGQVDPFEEAAPASSASSGSIRQTGSRSEPVFRRGASAHCHCRAYRDARLRAHGSHAAGLRAQRSTYRSGVRSRRDPVFRPRCSRKRLHAGQAGKRTGGTPSMPCNRCSVVSSRRTNSRPIVLRTHHEACRKVLDDPAGAGDVDRLDAGVGPSAIAQQCATRFLERGPIEGRQGVSGFLRVERAGVNGCRWHGKLSHLAPCRPYHTPITSGRSLAVCDRAPLRQVER